MAKKPKYECTECGYTTNKWYGRCPNCGEWGSFSENSEDEKIVSHMIKYDKLEVVNINEVKKDTKLRITTNFKEFDEILGGGLVKGEVVLITGNPGIGKSTILLQLSNEYAKKKSVYYISGEESTKQIKDRADRLNIKSKNLYLVSISSIENILNEIENNKPDIVVIDSIQTMYSKELSSLPGSTTQIKETCMQIIEIAKKYDISFYIVGHVTKDGKLAGPKLLEHMVDACIQIEGDEQNYFRIVRSSKNRFGSTNELAIFNMKDTGMEEVKNPSEFFLSERDEKNIGSIVGATNEGSKTILYEVQSLINTNTFGYPKRIVQGYDKGRVEILIAILSRYLNVDMSGYDIYINIPGGIDVYDRALDLSLAFSLISSYKNVAISQKIAAVGELGLRGEVRKVSFLKKRIQELEKLGFSGVYVPYHQMEELSKEKFKIKLSYIKNIEELVERIN